MTDDLTAPTRANAFDTTYDLDARTLAWHRLAETVRAINQSLLDLDASEADLAAANERAQAFAASLRAIRGDGEHWRNGTSSPEGRSLILDRSPIIGMGNPTAPPITIITNGDIVEGRARFGLQYEGPPGHVHGGWIAAGFDEVLGVAQKRTPRPGLTGTLTVRYRKPAPLHDELRFEAKVDRVEGRKMFITGTLHHGETLCADAEGIFVLVDPSAFTTMRESAAGRGAPGSP